MDILDWLQGVDSRPDARHARWVGEAVDRIVGLHPRLRLARHYRTRLESAAATTLQYLLGVVGSLPPPREASAAAWAVDPWIHAFFASADEVARILGRSAALRDFFDRNVDLLEAHAVLVMELSERHVLGVVQDGEGVRRDVPLTTVNFSDHRVSVCGRTGPDLDNEIVRRGLDQLALEGLARVAADNTRREQLERERALLGMRLQMLEQQGAGVGSLQTKVDENLRELASLGPRSDAIDNALERVREVLADPAAHLTVTSKRLRLSRMNVVQEGNGNGDAEEIELPLARIPGDPPQLRAFALVRFARVDMLDADSLLEEGARLLF